MNTLRYSSLCTASLVWSTNVYWYVCRLSNGADDGADSRRRFLFSNVAVFLPSFLPSTLIIYSLDDSGVCWNGFGIKLIIYCYIWRMRNKSPDVASLMTYWSRFRDEKKISFSTNILNIIVVARFTCFNQNIWNCELSVFLTRRFTLSTSRCCVVISSTCYFSSMQRGVNRPSINHQVHQTVHANVSVHLRLNVVRKVRYDSSSRIRSCYRCVVHPLYSFASNVLGALGK